MVKFKKYISSFLRKSLNGLIRNKREVNDISDVNIKDEYVVISFTGGMGAQILSCGIYFDLFEKGFKVAADLSYFDGNEMEPYQLDNGLTHWHWQLYDFGISKDFFSTDFGKKHVYVSDGLLKSELAFNAFLNPKVKIKFADITFKNIQNECLLKYGVNFSNPNYLCLHIRRGDYLNVASYLVPDNYFLDISSKFIGLVDTIVVFSDSPLSADFTNEVKKGFMQSFLFENSNFSPFLTHSVMRHAKILVCSNSQFSFTAGILNDNLVILPKIWFGKELDKLNQQISKLANFVVLS